MRLTLEQLTLAELRDVCRQHGLPDTYNADDMRQRIRHAVTACDATRKATHTT